MSALKAGDAFPEGVSFTYVAPTGELDLTSCGLPIQYDASKGIYPTCHSSPLPARHPPRFTNLPAPRVQEQEGRPSCGARRVHANLPGSARSILHQQPRQAQGSRRGPGHRDRQQ